MKEWKTYKVGEICSSISETYKGHSKSVVLINTSDVLEGRCLNHELVPNKDLKGQFKKVFKFGDILYSEIRPANKRFAYIDFDAIDYIASTKLMVLRNNENVSNRFLYHFLKSESTIAELQALAESRSGTFPQITFSELSQLEISIPDIETQLAISNFIDTLESKIELNRQINDNLEQQAQALYKSWFVDFEPFLDGDFVESELGLIPKDWQCIQFSTFVSESKVKTGEIGIKEFSVTNSGIFPRDAKYNKSLSQSSAKNKLIQRGDLVFGMSREILNWGVMQEERGGVSSAYAVYNINSALVSSTYLELFIKSRVYLFSDLIRPAAREGQSIDKSLLQTKVLLLPPKDVLDTFWPLYNSLINQIQTTVTEIDSLGNIRDTLLPKLMSGELKINEIDS